ncbi:MAG: DUF2905 domain-containing protein [Anaerolineae bacterium]
MPDLSAMGRMFLVIGGLFLLLGLILILAPRLPFIGRLPGDILIQRKNFTFYFPLVSCLLGSLLLTILLNLIFWLLRR